MAGADDPHITWHQQQSNDLSRMALMSGGGGGNLGGAAGNGGGLEVRASRRRLRLLFLRGFWYGWRLVEAAFLGVSWCECSGR